MMTYEEILDLVNQNVIDSEENKEKCAKSLQAYYFPTYKPLSELAGDEESARKVFNKLSELLGHEATEAQFEEWKMDLVNKVTKGLYDNIFATVDLIRECGYSA